MIAHLIPQKKLESWSFVTRSAMAREHLALNRPSIFAFLVIASVAIIDVSARAPQRLIDGSDAAPGEIVFQASLRLNGRHHCGGAIVSTRHILTAAHCLYEVEVPYDALTVVTGSNNLEKGGEVFKVDDIDIHENYTSNPDGSYAHDIAMITLVGDMDVNTYQAPVVLPESDAVDHVVGTVSGWGMGYDDFPDGDYSKILQKSDMTVLTHNECQKLHKLNEIGEDNICGFRNSFSGVCSGDDGSPLVFNDTLIGIVSWYYPCAIGLPDVYTEVHHYYDWILEGLSRGFYNSRRI
ncbi:chymotrypsin-1-like [Venturia canescens]|uniref:chymotrypsin-1-like n=1 Tax=Venturia canescens TaxID=32260 RepID=UPI001C9CDDC1|nr:chymotrypsin-1-like [Venturia canescens]